MFESIVLRKPVLEQDGMLRVRKSKTPVAFLYVLNGEERIYIFAKYKKYRTKIEEIFAEQRERCTNLHLVVWEDDDSYS